MSLLQAFSLGLPAIVTDVGGMAEVVKLARAGITVRPTDPADMAKAILLLSGNEKEREQFSTNGLAEYQTRFTVQSMVDTYRDLYRSIA